MKISVDLFYVYKTKAETEPLTHREIMESITDLVGVFPVPFAHFTPDYQSKVLANVNYSDSIWLSRKDLEEIASGLLIFIDLENDTEFSRYMMDGMGVFTELHDKHYIVLPKTKDAFERAYGDGKDGYQYYNIYLRNLEELGYPMSVVRLPSSLAFIQGHESIFSKMMDYTFVDLGLDELEDIVELLPKCKRHFDKHEFKEDYEMLLAAMTDSLTKGEPLTVETD